MVPHNNFSGKNEGRGRKELVPMYPIGLPQRGSVVPPVGGQEGCMANTFHNISWVEESPSNHLWDKVIPVWEESMIGIQSYP